MDNQSGDNPMDSSHTNNAAPVASGSPNAFGSAHSSYPFHPSHRSDPSYPSHSSHPSQSPPPGNAGGAAPVSAAPAPAPASAASPDPAPRAVSVSASPAGSGRVAALHVGARKKEPLASVESIRVVAGRGIEGDRFFRKSPGGENPHPGREITLIESEALEALAGETGISLAPRETRRNVLTRGISLNPLVGQRFRVGETELEGIELCEPCGHLELLTRKGVKAGLVHRGGLRARIARGGEIRIGDSVTNA